MENNVSPEKKDSILKTLAIAGFIGVLLLVAWLSIQLVHLFPSAFGSLASLAEGVNQYQETVLDTNGETLPLTVTSNTSLLNTGEELTVNWSKVHTAGSYVFSYECIDGVSIQHKTEAGGRSIDCDTNYNIGDINSFTIGIESEKNRYADVPFTLAFLRTEDTSPRAQGGNVVTIVNTDVASQFAFNGTDETEATVDTTPDVPSTSTEVEPVTPTPTTPAEPAVAQEPFEQEFAYTVPVSSPDGYTDLATSFIGMGEIINGAYVPGPVSVKNAGAIQFSVKNVGTKTSRDWTYSIALPNGDTYESAEQKELKPNERAVITIGFPAGATTPHTFVVNVDERTDRRSNNDSFNQVVEFAK